MNSTKLDYGIDAPGVIRNLILVGFALLVLSWFLPVLTLGPVRFALRPMAIGVGSVCLLEGAAMLLYAKVGKFYHRDQMLARIIWTGTRNSSRRRHRSRLANDRRGTKVDHRKSCRH